MEELLDDFEPKPGNEAKLISTYIGAGKLNAVPWKYLTPDFLSQKVKSSGATNLHLAVKFKQVCHIPEETRLAMDLDVRFKGRNFLHHAVSHGTIGEIPDVFFSSALLLAIDSKGKTVYERAVDRDRSVCLLSDVE